MTKLEELGKIVQHFRESIGESQAVFGKNLGSNRSAIAHLEQGLKVPEKELLTNICETLNIPDYFWKPFVNEDGKQRVDFEFFISELVGKNVSLDLLSSIERKEAEIHIDQLFQLNTNKKQIFDSLNRCLIFYGVKKVSLPFFEYYFIHETTFKSMNNFGYAILAYQKDAIKVFSTFALAYEELNLNKESFEKYLLHLNVKSLDLYAERNSWTSIIEIPNKDLPFLGYIAAEKVKKETEERKKLTDFLEKVILNFDKDGKIDSTSLEKVYGVKTLNQMDSLLRKFNSKLEHGLRSSLFSVDKDLFMREKEFLAPKKDLEIVQMKTIQDQAFANLTNYLTADYMDLYIATSMRTEGDFRSVNEFVKNLMLHPDIKKLNLRYFNPTQSWIEDRVSKGLVEALMLKRASLTIYMAQKVDTFGKDSEASVSLGQGKPVIVYVPKLCVPELNLDSEILSNMDIKSLQNILGIENINEDDDKQALFSMVLTNLLDQADSTLLIDVSKKYWAEFDFESEVERVKEISEKEEFRSFIDGLKEDQEIVDISEELKKNIKIILIAAIINYENRARIFKEIHPLALQVILSSGVLNGILVTRSLDSCANLLLKILSNNLDLELIIDENNYKLIEKSTGSVIRVISKNILLSHAFEQFYKDEG